MLSKSTNKNNMSLGMEIKIYGKGYLLVPTKNHQDYGTKYYNNGWWIPKHNAWFFKKEYKDYLENNFGKSKKGEKTKFFEKKVLDQMEFKEHGKGFLLVPEEGHPDWGTKHYHNGWWMSKHNAWFFKKEYKDYLENNFSKSKTQKKIIKPEKKNKKCGKEMLNDLVIKEYGKGYLVVPDKGHPDWGTKYYHNGWWMPKHNAWFFKKDDVKGIIVDYKEDTEKNIFEGFKLQKYGKGYLLTVDKNHPDWGEKYYYNGWWFSKQNGWFFKKGWKSFLVDNGAIMNPKPFKDNTMTFYDYKMESYGKGLLLKPPSNYCQLGEKYYYGGWWFPKQNGWFFKKEFEQFLKDNGASY